MKTVSIYSTPTCPHCKAMKAYFDEKGIVFEDIDVSQDEANQKKMIEISGQMGVPVIVIKDGDKEDIIVGEDKATFNKIYGLN
jgi:glutaredoxin-like YruB-family protein